jgi:hypothetical protein
MNATLDRGMVKWAPYQSLVEQATSLAFMRRQKAKVAKPQLSNEAAEEINEILVDYCDEEVTAKYWRDGFFYEATGPISRIDTVFRYLVIGETKIELRSLVALTRD